MDNEWVYAGESFQLDHTQAWFGFVYLITNTQTGCKYIGKKQFYFSRKKKGKRILIESDWKDYYGSSERLLKDVEMLGKGVFIREILSLHTNKRDLSYTELQEQFNRNVLENEEYYNDSIGGKWYRYLGGVFEKKDVNVFEYNGTQYVCHSPQRRKELSNRWKKLNPNDSPGARERLRKKMIEQIDSGGIPHPPHTEETKQKISDHKKGKSNPRVLCFDGQDVLTLSNYMKKHRIGYYSVIDKLENGIIIRATDDQVNSYSCQKVLSEEHKTKLRDILNKIRPRGSSSTP